jgi:bacteriocin resistance YdeI/OmpD-like protein/uncharacterized protein DUF1905
VRFTTTIRQTSGTATGIRVPDEVMAALAAGKAPKVAVTINGHTYRSSVAMMGGEPMIGVSEAVRTASGVRGGETVEVDVVVDTAPRVIAVPDDLAAALDAEPAARATFDKLSYSNQRFWVEPIEAAKAEETRRRRIEKAVATLAEGRAR